MVLELELSGISTFIPVFGFLLVFVVCYALLAKTEILGKNRFVHIFTSFCIAIIFLVSANAIEYIKTVTPWFVIFLISLVFIFMIAGLMRKNLEEVVGNRGFTWFVIIALIVVFLVSASYVFSDFINKYMAQQRTFALQPQIIGIAALVAVAAFASWLMWQSSKIKN